jgi:hypothetical protein
MISACANVLLLIFIWHYFPGGIYYGGDWSFPESVQQINKLSSKVDFWDNNYNFGKINPILGFSKYLYKYWMILSWLQIPVEFFPKVTVLLLSIIILIGVHLCVDEFNINILIAFPLALILLLQPLVYNYLTIGWILVLNAYCFMPLFYWSSIKYCNTSKWQYGLLSGIIFALAFSQVQAIGWYSFILVCVYFSNKYQIRSIIHHFIWIVLISLVAYSEAFFMMISGSPDTSYTKVAVDQQSYGADLKMSVLNLMQLKGSLANYQMESFTDNFLLLRILYLIPVVVIVTSLIVPKIFLKIKIELVALLLLIGFITFGVHNREMLFAIPLMSVFRHLMRFEVIMIFLMFIIFIKILIYINGKKIKILFLFLSLAYLFSLGYAWKINDIFAGNKDGIVSSIRVDSPDRNMLQVEEIIVNTPKNTRVMYLPPGFNQKKFSDHRYNDDYENIIDTFAIYSPRPRHIMSDNRWGSINIDFISSEYDNFKIDHFLENAPVDYIILRWQFFENPSYVRKKLESNLMKLDTEIYYDSDTVTLYRIKSNKVPLIGIRDLKVNNNIVFKEITPSNYEVESFCIVCDIIFRETYDYRWVYVSKILDKSCLSHSLSLINTPNCLYLLTKRFVYTQAKSYESSFSSFNYFVLDNYVEHGQMKYLSGNLIFLPSIIYIYLNNLVILALLFTLFMLLIINLIKSSGLTVWPKQLRDKLIFLK